MRILWDDEKNEKLKSERGVSFEEAAACILNDEIIEMMKNPARPGQYYFIMELNGYTHVVLFIKKGKENIILKSIYPSRKFHKIYRGKK